jgi:hypothetical protein
MGLDRIFLLSPADCGGQRAQLMLNPESRFDLARRLRQPPGVPLGEAFSFISGLYFRGKLAYARAFAARTRSDSIYVITAGEGLQPVDVLITLEHLQRYAAVPIAAGESRYRAPLERDSRALAARVGEDAAVVLLGSIASGKYLEVLVDVFGRRLHLPRQLIGMGDMSRGSLLLRCVAQGRELDYLSVADIDRDLLPRRVRVQR